MDPITVVATLIATKAIEKVGEKMGEGGLSLGGRLMQKLRRSAPKAVERLEASADPTVIDAEILEEIRQVADANPDVKTDIDATVQAIQQQFGGVINQTQLAEKIGILIQGGYNPITIEKFEL
jgi:hypothetical protein